MRLATALFALSLACATAEQPHAPAQQSSAALTSSAVPAEEAGRYAGKSAVIEFTVVQVGGGKGSTFLNSKPHTPQSEDFVAFIPRDAKQAFTAAFGEDLRAAFQGKRVRVSGEVTIFKGQPEIVLKSPEQLQVVQ